MYYPYVRYSPSYHKALVDRAHIPGVLDLRHLRSLLNINLSGLFRVWRHGRGFFEEIDQHAQDLFIVLMTSDHNTLAPLMKY